MWAANRDPAADLANLQRLMAVLDTITADHFVLISTIAVLDDCIPAGEAALPRADVVVNSDIVAKDLATPAVMIARDPQDR